MEAAEEELTRGDYDDAVHDLREALEKMVTDKYDNALDELVSEDLIGESDTNINDRELLYTPYGYVSTVGSHTKPGESGATQYQAEMALVLVEETVYFLLRKLEAAEEKGESLDKWIEIG